MPSDLPMPSRATGGAVGLLDPVETVQISGRSIRHWYLFWPVVAYLAARSLTVAGLAVADLFVRHDGLYEQLYRWDGIWFVTAATHGYPSHLPMLHGHVTGSTIAFFPVFPLAIRWLSALTTAPPVVMAGVISGATGLTATIAVGMLVRSFTGRPEATRSALLFAVFPGTFVFSLMYSEGIVITCVAFGLLALLQRRWWLAGLLGLVATAASPIALAFAAACAWSSLRAILDGKTWKSLAAPVLAPLGFGATMVYFWLRTGRLTAWSLTERGGWHSYPSVVYPLHILATFLFDPIRPTETGQILFVGTVLTVVAAIVAIRERLPPPVLVYGMVAAAMAAVSAPVGLRPRFIMLAFPLVVAVAIRLRGRLYWWVVVGSACGLAAMTYLETFSKAVFP